VISATTLLILNNFFSVQCVVASRMPSTRRSRHSCHASSIHSLFLSFLCGWLPLEQKKNCTSGVRFQF